MRKTTGRLRSFLFVPATKPAWMRTALDSGADALIVDLEDAVPPAEKLAARQRVREFLEEDHGTVSVFVRVNGWGTGQILDDLAAIMSPNLSGVMLPKVESAQCVSSLARVLDELDPSPDQAIEILPIAETAAGMLHIESICRASTRVRRISGVAHAVPGGDFYAALGAQWDPDGREAILTGSMAVLAARAAGLDGVICGPISDVRDVELVRRVLRRGRLLGADSAMVIHPSHLSVVAEIFLPDAAEMAHHAQVVEAMEIALQRGESTAVVSGHMVDIAHLNHSRAVLEQAADVTTTTIKLKPELPRGE